MLGIAMVIVLLVGGHEVLSGRISPGDFAAFTIYTVMLTWPMIALGYVVNLFERGTASMVRIHELLIEEPTIDDRDAAPEKVRPIKGDVEFRHLSFSYGNSEILRDISLEIPAGTSLALVGLTGAGKTTLVSLIPRFYDTSTGRVLIDGRDVREYRVRPLREKIAIVLQEPVLFQGTIAENLRYGRLDATREEIEEAARAAHAHDFISHLAKGYDTEIAQAGGSLSGGERQRLSVARAIIKNAPILILDEPTSSLDAISEEIVFAALRRLRAGRTTIVIAHRLSTVRDADCILVLDGGRIAAKGRHDELLQSSQLYRRMCARLSVGKSLDDPETVDELIEAAKR
jgi:ATP-binding cassette, subfamily B, multidrug efflux pump